MRGTCWLSQGPSNGLDRTIRARVFVMRFFGAGGGSHGPKLFDGLLSKSAKAALEEYKKKEAEAVGALEASAKEKTTEARSQLAAVRFSWYQRLEFCGSDRFFVLPVTLVHPLSFLRMGP